MRIEHLLRRHVGGRPHHRLRPRLVYVRLAARTREAHDAQVRQLRRPVLREQHVLRLQVAVDEPVRLNAHERTREVRRDGRDARQRKAVRGRLERIPQRPARQVFHHQKAQSRVRVTSRLADRQQVRMPNLHRQFRLADKAADKARIALRVLRIEHLHGILGPARLVQDKVNLPRAALAKQPKNLVGAEISADCQNGRFRFRHRPRLYHESQAK